jgi:hypothetical protein
MAPMRSTRAPPLVPSFLILLRHSLTVITDVPEWERSRTQRKTCSPGLSTSSEILERCMDFRSLACTSSTTYLGVSLHSTQAEVCSAVCDITKHGVRFTLINHYSCCDSRCRAGPDKTVRPDTDAEVFSFKLDVVSYNVEIPSLSSFGFSSLPSPTWNNGDTVRIFHHLITEVLGYPRYMVFGSGLMSVRQLAIRPPLLTLIFLNCRALGPLVTCILATRRALRPLTLLSSPSNLPLSHIKIRLLAKRVSLLYASLKRIL